MAQTWLRRQLSLWPGNPNQILGTGKTNKRGSLMDVFNPLISADINDELVNKDKHTISAASFLITPRLIEEALQFPRDHHIFDIKWCQESQNILVYITGPKLPSVQDGQTIPHITPTIHKEIQDNVTVINWRWNAGKS